MDGQARVAVLCGNRLLRESIARILSKRTSFQLAASQSFATLCANGVEESGADVVVCDSLPFVVGDRPGPLLDRTGKHPVKSVLVAMDDDVENFVTAVRHGVLGYVLQEASAAEVVSAIRSVAAGEAVCPAQFIRVLFEHVASQPSESRTTSEQLGFTRREQQLIPLINRGLTNKEIANQLNIGEQTVKSHIHRILRKAGTGNRQSLSRLSAPVYPS